MTRRTNDAYYTPQWAVDQLLNRVDIPRYAHIFEPCCGNGAISNRLRVMGRSNISTNDIDQNVKALSHYDYLSQDFARVDWIITNPPFSLALQFLIKAFDGTRQGVAMLLRLSFLEPTFERGEWLDQNPPTHLIVTPRISFTNDGKSDSVTTAWMVWDKRATQQYIGVLPKSKTLRRLERIAA